MSKEQESVWIPETPAGSMLAHLEADTEDQAWLNLLEDAKHMPYDGIQGFKERGYKVERWYEPDEAFDDDTFGFVISGFDAKRLLEYQILRDTKDYPFEVEELFDLLDSLVESACSAMGPDGEDE